MNEKDYKEIAKIIKKRLIAYAGIGITSKAIKGLSLDLADYFEKSNFAYIDHCGNQLIKGRFDRKQFLKDCGVDVK